MKEHFDLLKRGNKSALMAAVVNTIISIIKGIAFTLTGNVAMFAETMHSIGDAANQFFVFIGSALSKKAPTSRFPNGFGRLVNLVLLGAVLVVGVMSYETIKEGIHHILHPVSSEGFLINISVLGAAFVLECIVLYKAMVEVLHESQVSGSGLAVIPKSFKYLKKAKPATRLVFMEDLVATSGGLVAIVAVLIAHYSPFHAAEGIASILIGVMMLFVVCRVFLENAAGALGEADEEMQHVIGQLVMQDIDVKDVKEIVVIKEGEDLHVEVKIEVAPDMTVAQTEAVKKRLENAILKQNSVSDVVIAFSEDDGISEWTDKEEK